MQQGETARARAHPPAVLWLRSSAEGTLGGASVGEGIALSLLTAPGREGALLPAM
jgi:hypothetical protein